MLSFKNNDPIVVSGMSGKVANSDNIAQFQEQIYNKMDMITSNNNKRFPRMLEVPERYGIIPDIEKFDNGFFGVPGKEVAYMNPTNRMLLETICEALMDAGLSPQQIKGSRTGIYVAHCCSESENIFYHDTPPQTFAIKGASRIFSPLRVSHYLEIDGPSYVCDAACSASAYAIDHAIKDLEGGRIDYAIICGSNLIIAANTSQQYYRLGVLSHDGICKCFDDTANGYVRSDGCLCIILQRGSTAKRNYAEIVHSMVNNDGFKEMGITYPSREGQKMLLNEFYKECEIPVEKIGFVEAHGTGTTVGDLVELTAIEEFYCKTRKEPLFIGSVKSNLGHSEGSSGLASIMKACMIFETGIIPANINFHTPHSKAEGFKNGKLVVVTENTLFPNDKPYIATSNFGFGGANGHALLRRPIIKRPEVDEDFPRLLCIGGRTSEAVNTILEDIKARPYDPDYVALLNASFNSNIPEYDDRGFAIVSKSGVEVIETLNYTDYVLPLKCVFHTSGIIGVGHSLLKFKTFQEHLKQVQNILKKNNIAWDSTSLTSCSNNHVDNTLTTVIVQTGIANLLKVLNIDIADFFGTGVGEISASYADGVIPLDQALIAAQRITKLLCEKQKIDIITLSEELKDVCNFIAKPRKWKIDADVNGNFPQNLGEIMFTPKSPIARVDKENLLIIGGNAGNSSNIVSLCDKDVQHGFLHSLGRLYLLGYAMTINPLYSVTWPVHQGTPMISPLIMWRHDKIWTNRKFVQAPTFHKKYTISLNDPDWQIIDGHSTDGRILFPASGYFYLMWKAFAGDAEIPISFENITFLRACTLSKTVDLQLSVQICEKTGHFEITEGNELVVAGYIKDESDNENEWTDLDSLPTPRPEDLLSKRDVYKELGLRGYYYSGDFKEVQNCDVNATVATIKWKHWIPFMDAMFQLKKMQEDTRGMSVPTKISKVMIDPKKHLDIVYASGDVDNCFMSVYNYKDLDIIRCGHIEIRGISEISIGKRKPAVPVLESHRFVPYVANLNLRVAARVAAQLALENNYTIKLKVIEVFKDVPDTMEPLISYIQAALNDYPLIQPEFMVITDKNININNVSVTGKEASSETGIFIAVGYNLSENPELLKTLSATLKSGGFLISRESLKTTCANFPDGFTMLCEYTTPNERVIMVKVDNKIILPKAIHVSENGFKWLAPLKEARQKKEALLLYAENEPNNGILGLTNCLLRESSGEKLMSVLIDDKSAPGFDVGNVFYKKQLEKNLCINVYKNGTWGSYRHLLFEENHRVSTVQSYVNNTVRGDLSSLSWIQGNLSIPEIYNAETPGVSRVHVYVGALNTRDAMVATGQMTLDSVTKNRKCHESPMLGYEFAARKENGERVMGLYTAGALATVLHVKDDYLWKIPDDWTMEEAATVPVVYATLLYGLIMRSKLIEGESILIHLATEGIGLSAINIALYYNCNIFLTVGSEEKKDYILKNYPTISADHIGNSRDTSFYELILKQTGGKGVDLILHTLADQKLEASVKCLGIRGRFVDIGRVGTADSLLSTELAEREAEYHGVKFDIVISDAGEVLQIIRNLLYDGINKGFIKPIPKTCFGKDELEQAFRYMTSGSRIGKVLINLREEESNRFVIPKQMVAEAKPKFYCNPKGSYIIVGGLGGFGLELADLLAIRGAKNIVLVSRKGLSTGYQQLRLKIWKSYMCNIEISNHDLSTIEGCQALLNFAQKMGDLVGIFNTAAVIRDAVLENQTEKTFLESYNPKAQATIFLDQLTRKQTPKLEHFVVFSSYSCGRGVAGQSNYGYSNSVMERVCENRRKDGLPGKAIQWALLGDVGMVEESKEQNVEVVIAGTTQQKIASCLDVFDVFMCSEDNIVSSMVVAEIKSGKSEDNLIKVVLDLLQVKDIKTISPNSTFPELGMDSMMAVEIKQTLEREFDVFLSAQELRNMNFAKLNEIGNDKSPKSCHEAMLKNFQQLMRFIPSEEQCEIPVVTMKTKATDSSECSLYFLPGGEGMSTVFERLAEHLSVNAKCLQFSYYETRGTIKDMALQKVKILEEELKSNEPFTIAAHSLGVTIALEVLTMLEDMGYKGTLLMVDGAPMFNRTLITSLLDTTEEDTFQSSLITYVMSSVLHLDAIENMKKELMAAKSFDERCTIAMGASSAELNYSSEFMRNLLLSIYQRLNAELMHQFAPRTYKSRIVLCKAMITSVRDIPEDYGLRELLGNHLEIQEFDGDHVSVLHNAEFIKFVNDAVKSN